MQLDIYIYYLLNFKTNKGVVDWCNCFIVNLWSMVTGSWAMSLWVKMDLWVLWGLLCKEALNKEVRPILPKTKSGKWRKMWTKRALGLWVFELGTYFVKRHWIKKSKTYFVKRHWIKKSNPFCQKLRGDWTIWFSQNC